MKWGTDNETFDGEGTWANVSSDPIILNEVPTNTESIYVQVKLTGTNEGTYKSEEISITFDGTEATVDSEVTFTKEEPVTVSLSQTEVPVTGSGTASDKINQLAEGSIDLNTANLKDTTTVSGATGVKITFTEAGKAKIEGTLTLASGVQNVGDSVEFTQGINKGDLDGIESISKVVLNGTGDGSEWKVSGITIEAEATGDV